MRRPGSPSATPKRSLFRAPGSKTMSTRRDFLKATYGSAAALVLSGLAIASVVEAEWRNRRDDMR